MNLFKECLQTHGKYIEIKKKEQYVIQGSLAKKGQSLQGIHSHQFIRLRAISIFR